jgi:VacB/RNase II family 3'-5' exoribonuclease
VFSIDPLTAKDLDDAVSIKALPDGTFELGVHIADVSYFVKPNTNLDSEALHRATTVYLVQKAIPMLPRLLCEELCSLNPGVDRFSFSVVWTIDADANFIGDPWFGKSIIRSCGKLAYEHAQALIDGKTWDDLPPVTLSNNVSIDDIKNDTLFLFKISKILRKRRFDNGALAIQSIKLWFALDDVGNPIDTGVYRLKESNRLIEEVMLPYLCYSLCFWQIWR